VAAPAAVAAPVATETVDSTWVWRMRHAAVLALLVAVAINTDPGRIVGDTKLDLTLDPGALLARALHLWDPLGSAGQVQNQGYGYLFPMGPFFVAGEWLGVPDWVVQRLWWALLLGVSYTGFVLLASRLRLGSRWGVLVGGVAFALWPHVLTIIGRSSVEAWPVAWTPWVVLPLVGSEALARPVRAALLSGVAVVAMGGVNATVDLAAVLPAALWLASRRVSLQWARLAGCWVVAVLLATLWWVVPLLALSRFSPPFLDFIESASVTTRTATLVEALRGTSDWVAYLGDASTRAGGMLLTRPVLIVGTVAVTALGLAGIVLAGRRVRGWLSLLLVTGAVLTTLGYVGAVDSPMSAAARELLDGPLAPLRNTHKFDVLVRLSLTLGVVVAVEALSRGRSRAESALLRRVVTVGAAFAVITSASPFFALAVAPGASWTAVPGYWSEVADWLAEHDPDGRTLLAPGSRFADYEWGATSDEPMQALASSGWDVRSAVPLTGAGHIRWLDEVEHLLAEGRGGEDLAAALSEGGITHVLVRNDLDVAASAATRPLVAGAALGATPGIRRVASFGPVVGGLERGPVLVDDGLRLPAHAIDVYALDPGGDPRVSATPLSSVARVSGSAESLYGPGLGGAPVGLSNLDGSTAAVEDVRGPRVLTDTPRRRETNFGTGAFGSSQTLAADDPLRLDKPVLDYTTWPPSAGAGAVVSGVDAVRASSSASDADAYPRTDPGAMPYAAVDGDPATAWRPNPSLPARGAWWEVVLPTTRDIQGTVTVEGAGLGGVTSVRLTTDVGSTELAVAGDQVVLPPVRTSRLRITLDAVPERPALDVGIREVRIPGVVAHRSVVVPPVGPDDEVAAVDRVWLRADTGDGGCLTVGARPVCAPALVSGGEDAAGLDRTVTVPRMDARAAVTAVPRAGPSLDEAVQQALDLPVEVEGSSRAVGDPAAGPWAAVDGALDTAWLASGRDPTPTLTLSWDRPTRIDELTVLLDDYVAATTATGVEISSPAGSRKALLDPGGRATFAPLTTDRLSVRFVASPYTDSIDPYTLRRDPLGIGVSELEVPGVTGPISVSGSQGARPLTFPCGSGPVLDVGGAEVTTSVSTTVGDVLRGREVTARTCGEAPLALGPGTVQVVETGGPERGWAVTGVLLDRVAAPVATGGGAPPVTVTSWEAGRREVDLGARSEPVLLTVHENVNPGWQATLAGQGLQPVTVGGWQQGFVVPPGPSGQVVLRFAGDDAIRTGMLVGAVAGGALLVVGASVLVLSRRRGVAAQEPSARFDPAPEGVVAGVLAVLLAVLAGGWAVLAAVLVGGVRLVAGRLGGGRGRPPATRLAAWVAALAYLAAGAVLLTGPLGSADYRAGSVPAQFLSLLALTAVVSALTPGSWWRRKA
jgi:arabinofuranan 3-O-arabinosyltransferase